LEASLKFNAGIETPSLVICNIRLQSFLRCMMDDSEDAPIFPLPTFVSTFSVDLELISDLYRAVWTGDRRQHTTCSSVYDKGRIKTNAVRWVKCEKM